MGEGVGEPGGLQVVFHDDGLGLPGDGGDVAGRGHLPRGADDQQQVAARDQKIDEVNQQLSQQTGLKCDVTSLYDGGEYSAYCYRRYTDVRLVFAVETQIGYFGGDYDNFTFPRHDLDITFFRVYEDGRPAKIEHYLKWASKDVDEGELVIVPGFPGSTARLLTVAQLRYQRDLGLRARAGRGAQKKNHHES